MKKRESIGLILIVIAIFFLLLSLALNLYVEQVRDKIKNLKDTLNGKEEVSINLEKFGGEGIYGES
ncbi:MAG: hypothetical protein WC494_02150 [Candidatus Pacearchaeota archaeon]